MKVSLIVLTPGKSEGQAIPITLSQFLIGRDSQCQLRPASASISKRHCAVLVREGKVFVRDLDSTNGTYVNDQPVKGEVEVRHDDRLKIGPLLFGVRIEAKAPATRSATPAKKTAAPAAKAAAPAPQPAAAPAPKEAAAPEAETGSEAEEPVASVPGKAPPESMDDDSVAAWLLEGSDEGSAASADSSPEVASNTEVIERPPGDDTGQQPAASANKLDQAKQLQAQTSDVAKAILQKYMRRPRTG